MQLIDVDAISAFTIVEDDALLYIAWKIPRDKMVVETQANGC